MTQTEIAPDIHDLLDRCQRELVRRANEIRKALGMRPVKVDRDGERPRIVEVSQ